MAVLLTLQCNAQKLYHYSFIETSLGLHDLKPDLMSGSSEAKPGLCVTVGVVQDRTTRFAMQYGLGVETFASVQTLEGVTNVPDLDSEGDAYVYRTYLNRWVEKNSGFFLQIPVGVLYRYPLGEYAHLLSQGGLKLSIPLASSYRTVSGRLTTTGYYERWNVELYDMPEQGFQTTSEAYRGKFALAPALSVQAAVGVTYPIAWKKEIYLGVYGSCGLYSIGNKSAQDLFDQQGRYHGLFSSSLVKGVVPYAVGLKLALYFQLDQRRVNSW